jgi:hypothetical protein
MMDSAASPKIILGMALAASDGPLRDNPDLQDEMLDVCAAYGVKDLDTSYIYVSLFADLTLSSSNLNSHSGVLCASISLALKSY